MTTQRDKRAIPQCVCTFYFDVQTNCQAKSTHDTPSPELLQDKVGVLIARLPDEPQDHGSDNAQGLEPSPQKPKGCKSHEGETPIQASSVNEKKDGKPYGCQDEKERSH
jgi:hypothetical protein